MKLLAPLPLSTLIILGAGAAWFVLGNREYPPPSSTTGPRAPLVDTSLHERFLAAAADGNRTRRSARFAVIFRQMTPQSAAELAAEFWGREKSSPFQNDWYDFLRRWTELDPAGPLAFAQANAGTLLDDWLLVILPAWSSRDPDAAIRWWLTSGGSGGESLAAALIATWADQDWQAAARWVENNSEGPRQASLALALATRAVAVDPSGVQARIQERLAVEGLPSATETALFLRLAGHKLHHERAEAIPWLASVRSTFPCSHLIGADCEEWLMRDAARSLVTNEEQGAWLTWLTSVPPAEQRSGWDSISYGSGGFVFSNWLASDVESASQWLRGQPAGTSYDTLAGVLAIAVAEESPELATAWALSVKSQERRASIWGEWQQRGFPVTPDIAAAIQRDGYSISYYTRKPPADTAAPPPN